MPSKKYLIVYGLVSILPILVTLIVYPFVPDVVPTHFNAQNVADAFGNKSSVWIVSLVFFSCSLLVLGSNIYNARNTRKNNSIIKIKSDFKIGLITVVFLDIISLTILYATINYNESNPFNIGGIIFPIVILLCVYSLYEAKRVKKIEKNIKEKINETI